MKTKEINIEIPKFPIVSISGDGLVEYFRDLSDLSTPPKSMLGIKYFESMTIIDILGNSFKIINYELVQTLIPSWIQSRRKVMLEFEFDGIIELSNIKSLLVGSINKHIDFWDSSGDLESLLVRINKFNSAPDLIETLCAEYYKKY